MRARIARRIAIFAVAIHLMPFPAHAQPPARVPRIGFLWLGAASAAAPRLKAFQEGLRELGYVDGRTIAIEYRFAEGDPDRLRVLATELAHRRVALIITFGEASILAARKATNTIPIVAALAGDLVRPGHAASLARPGGNVTGLVDISPELSAKRVQLLKELLPNASRLAVLWNPTNRVKAADFRETQGAARALGIELRSVEVKGANTLEPAFAAMKRAPVDALLVLSDAFINTHRRRILEFAAKSRLPGMYFSREWVEAGGLLAYGPAEPDMFRRAATYVDKILKGASPADLPIEQPTKLELVINLGTAKALDLAIPQSVLIRADQVIQ